jgi:uncharacterized protein YeaO (DUF488 family)
VAGVVLTVCALSSCGGGGGGPASDDVTGSAPATTSSTGEQPAKSSAADGESTTTSSTGEQPTENSSAGGSPGEGPSGGETNGEEPGGEEPGGGGPPTTTASQPTRVALDEFLRRCEEGVRDWQAAQVDYPSELTVEVGETVSYVAAVDASDTPLPPESAVPGPSATAEGVFVRCEIAARLTAVGDGLAVDSERWVVRSFTPTGLIRWSWGVTASEPGEADLQLELQPAARSEDGEILVSELSTEVSSFFTRTRVTEDPVQGMGRWWADHWGAVTLVAGGVGAAVLGLLGYGKKLVEKLRAFRAAVRGGGRAGEHENEIVVARVGDVLPGSGRRFLVERLLPAGIRRADLAPDGWLEDAAPSEELQQWSASRPGRWEGFRERYTAELDDRPESWRPVLEAARAGDVVLIYAASDREHNNAVVLRDLVLQRLGAPVTGG